MTEASKDANGRLIINEPRWEQNTFTGRAKHFFTVTDPRNLFHSDSKLDQAKILVEKYRLGTEPPGTNDERIWYAKKIYDSAFHPETGEKQIIIGRMSAQVPCNMLITGAMMTFYKKLFQVYASATGCALVTAIGLNSMVKTLPPIFGRYVPFAAVAAANCFNIPLMRQRELIDGIPVFDKDGNRIGDSKIAAKKAITMTVASRIAMATPGMCIPPLIMNQLEKKAFMKRMPWLASPFQILAVGVCLVFATPLCCAIFPQTSSMAFDRLEPELQEMAKKNDLDSTGRVYFNKGL